MNAPYTAAELTAILARADAATPGPWAWADEPEVGCSLRLAHLTLHWESDGEPGADDDAAFIAHAREDVPRLVAELRRTRETLQTHGKHGSDCNLYQSFDKDPGHCRCGLSQALRAALGEPVDG